MENVFKYAILLPIILPMILLGIVVIFSAILVFTDLRFRDR